MQVRLVRVDPARAREVADLMAACERLRQEADRLLTRVVDLLHEEVRDARGDRPSLRSTLD
ncbi:hypothetical protein ACFQY9_16965 [Microvirga aerilata]|uniref:hypothetical protein n=1 Tax=Microvirga aerilata TaxID=670292 RepID=UPI0036394132